MRITGRKITGLPSLRMQKENEPPLFDVGGEMLVVSQFTLLGDCRKGKRPSFTCAAKPKRQIVSIDVLLKHVGTRNTYEEGVFRAEMLVESKPRTGDADIGQPQVVLK